MFPNANGWMHQKRDASRVPQILLIYAVTFLVGMTAVSGAICKTTECKETAAAILNNMDTNVEPCEDFYEFACGNFIRKNKGTKNFVFEGDDIIIDRLKVLLEQPITAKDIRPFVLAKKYYQSCLIWYADKTCVTNVISDLDIAATALYTRAYITADVKKSVDDIAKHLRTAFLKVVKEIKWMDDTTKAHALEKINFMKQIVSYPNEFFDDTALENFYSELTFTTEMFLFMQPEAEKFKSKIPQYADANYEWYMEQTLSGGRAFYVPSVNEMVITPGILTGRVFNKNWPAYRNYGSLGMIVGHEYAHSVDTKGKYFDKDGKRADWWSIWSNAIYNLKAQCVIDQYNEYIEPDSHRHVNGSRTIGENIADNIGFELAYVAYQQAIDQNPPQSLPGLEKFDSNQMFWISGANTWCSTYSEEALQHSMLNSVHTTNRFRVHGPFSMNKHFNDDFKCSKSSTMNQAHKCDLNEVIGV